MNVFPVLKDSSAEAEQKFLQQVADWLIYEKKQVEYALKHSNLKEEGPRKMIIVQLKNITSKLQNIPVPYELAIGFHEFKYKIMSFFMEIEQEIVRTRMTTPIKSKKL